MNTLQTMIHDTKHTVNFSQHPYFKALEHNTFERDAFVYTQLQFLHAVAFFPRPLLMLAARMPEATMRLPLVENAFEEHGEGDLSKSHEQTFLRLLHKLGVSKRCLDHTPQGPDVMAFNAMFWSVCQSGHPLMAVAMIGMFEDLFCEISMRIGTAIVHNGWLPRQDVEHYNTHETLDEEHARELYDIIRMHGGAEQMGDVQQGLELGAASLMTLFEQLYHRRHQWRCTHQQAPHSAFGYVSKQCA